MSVRTLYTLLAGAVLFTTGPGYSEPLLEHDDLLVGKINMTLIDQSRPTAKNNSAPATDQRELKTSVWYPAQPRDLEWLRPGPAPIDDRVCPAPLVIYSHGFMSMRQNGAYIAEYLAHRGYIVAAANFPLTHLGTLGGPQLIDVLNQPGDVSFIIDSLLDHAGDTSPDLADCIDPQRIAAIGLSLGGLTTTLLAFHPELHDPRIRAAVAIAGPTALLGEEFFQRDAPPYMVIASDIDAMIDYRANAVALANWYPAATVVTLHGGSHTGFAGMTARFFRWLDNPDGIGCWAMRGKLDAQRDIPDAFMADLRGQAGYEATDKSLLPCRDPELPLALRPQYQLMLTSHSIYAFLQSHFHPDRDARKHYAHELTVTLPQTYPELTVGRAQ